MHVTMVQTSCHEPIDQASLFYLREYMHIHSECDEFPLAFFLTWYMHCASLLLELHVHV